MSIPSQVYSLLSDPLLTAETIHGRVSSTLPELLARLLTEPLPALSFPHVTAVQRGHWWRFLVRTAAHVHHAMGRNEATSLQAHEIRRVLGESTGGEDAWCLVNTDWGRPAFLQTPTPSGLAPEREFKAEPISYLSSALGSKNHERKVDATPMLTPEQVVYGLVELQGGAIYGGRGNYPTQFTGSRSGKGSGTPFMGVLLPEGWGATFRHDVGVLLATWDSLERHTGLQGRVWALWAEPWDGATSLSATKLTPAFIPLARMIRLPPPGPDDAFRTVYHRAEGANRVEDHTGGGNLGDPFLPLVRHGDGWKIRGVVAHSAARPAYDYRETTAFFTDPEERRPSPTVQAFVRSPPRLGDQPALLILEGLAFEQGKTLGFHQRTVPVFRSDTTILAAPEPLRAAHSFMSNAVQRASSALRGAVRIVLHGESRPRAGDGGPLDKASAPLMHRIEEQYIAVLFEAGRQEAEGRDEYKERWVEQLREWTSDTLRQAEDGLPRAEARRYERSVGAEAFLLRKFREMLGEVRGQDDATQTDQENTP